MRSRLIHRPLLRLRRVRTRRRYVPDGCCVWRAARSQDVLQGASATLALACPGRDSLTVCFRVSCAVPAGGPRAST